MMNGPGLFSGIGKRAKDLLTNGYVSDQTFSISTCSDTGMILTSTAVKNGGLSTGVVGAMYNYKNTLINVTADTESNISTTFIITDILPSTNVISSFKVPNYSSSKLEAQYFHNHATCTTGVALNKSPVVDFTATLGTPTIAFGVEGGYDTTSCNFIKYTAGVCVSTPESCTSIILGDKGDTIKASCLLHLDQRSTRVVEISRRFSTNENTFTVGASYTIDDLTLVKAKGNNHGKLGVMFQHEVIPKSLVTIAGEFDTLALDKTPRFGWALSLKA